MKITVAVDLDYMQMSETEVEEMVGGYQGKLVRLSFGMTDDMKTRIEMEGDAEFVLGALMHIPAYRKVLREVSA